MNDSSRPSWATGEGTQKTCRRCGRPFTDWTKKQKWIHCLSCWRIERDKYPPGEEPFSVKVRRTYAKDRPLDHRICKNCDGMGCLGCENGIQDYPAEKELFLGVEK